MRVISSVMPLTANSILDMMEECVERARLANGNLTLCAFFVSYELALLFPKLGVYPPVFYIDWNLKHICCYIRCA